MIFGATWVIWASALRNSLSRWGGWLTTDHLIRYSVGLGNGRYLPASASTYSFETETISKTEKTKEKIIQRYLKIHSHEASWLKLGQHQPTS